MGSGVDQRSVKTQLPALCDHSIARSLQRAVGRGGPNHDFGRTIGLGRPSEEIRRRAIGHRHRHQDFGVCSLDERKQRPLKHAIGRCFERHQLCHRHQWPRDTVRETQSGASSQMRETERSVWPSRTCDIIPCAAGQKHIPTMGSPSSGSVFNNLSRGVNFLFASTLVTYSSSSRISCSGATSRLRR